MPAARILLKAAGLEKSFGGETLFKAEKLEIQDGQRIGLAGRNGSGKTTLLRILYGACAPDAGCVERACAAAWLRQPELVIQDGQAVAGPKSGGELMREAVREVLDQHAPLLFADEPTTNLDLDSTAMVEKELRRYPGAVVLVSHDRVLLEQVCDTIWAIEGQRVRIFPGSYHAWEEQREQERAFAQFEYEQYCREKQRLQTEIRNIRQQAKGMAKPPRHMSSSEWMLYKGGASVQQGHVQSRAKNMEKRLERMEEKKAPPKLPVLHMEARQAFPLVSRTAVRAQDLTLWRGGHAVVSNVSFTLPTGKKTVMLGKNGSGKSTIAEAILAGTASGLWRAQGLRAGYFSQSHEVLDPAMTVLENARAQSLLPQSEVRTILANLLLKEDSIHKPVTALSGGERAKAAFARLLASQCNFLILDEPTNHIDSFAAQALETLLRQWDGTLLVITHDRRLAEQVGERLLFVGDGAVNTFEGTYLQWRQKQEEKPLAGEQMSHLMEQLRRAAECAPPGSKRSR